MKTRTVVAIVPTLLTLAGAAAQPVLYERAVQGPTGQSGGSGISVSNFFYTGWRFEVTDGPVTTTRIGGHFFGGSGTAFGAIIALTGPSDDPDAFDLSTPDRLGTTLVPMTSSSSHVAMGDLSLTLQNGWYLVIFGGGAFGATTDTPGLIAQDSSTAVPGAQLNITYRQPAHPAGQGGPFLQGAVARCFVEGVRGGAICYANCDGSTATPVLNVNDFICFQNQFAAGDSRANCDGSTAVPVLNVNDFVCFSNQFAAGCP